MTTALKIPTKITERIGHDKMSIKGTCASGATLSFTVDRNGEKLISGLGGDTRTSDSRGKEVAEWLKFREGELNVHRFMRLRKVLEASDCGAAVVFNLSKF